MPPLCEIRYDNLPNVDAAFATALAAEWLAHEQVLVREAARRLGYPDQYQFSRAFKRVFGIAPAQFRRGHRVAPHSAR